MTLVIYMGTFGLVGLKVILGHSMHSSQNGLISKKAGRRAKWSETGDLWIPVTAYAYMGYIDLVGFNVISGSFSALLSRAGHRVKRSKVMIVDTSNTHMGYI